MDDQEIENLKRYFIEHQTEEKDDQDREHLSRYFEKHPYEGGAWVAEYEIENWKSCPNAQQHHRKSAMQALGSLVKLFHVGEQKTTNRRFKLPPLAMAECNGRMSAGPARREQLQRTRYCV